MFQRTLKLKNAWSFDKFTRASRCEWHDVENHEFIVQDKFRKDI